MERPQAEMVKNLAFIKRAPEEIFKDDFGRYQKHFVYMRCCYKIIKKIQNMRSITGYCIAL